MRAVIFDLDGTLIDSEAAYFAFDRAFFAAWGIDYDPDLCLRCLGIRMEDSFALLDGLFPGNGLSSFPMAERIRLHEEAKRGWRGEAPRPFPSTVGLARELSRRGLPLAVASGSSLEMLRRGLALAGILDRFGAIVSAEEVPSGKPAPDVFLEAARRLGLPPGDCLVVEDAPAGLAAARAAGMSCVVLPAPGADPAAFPGALRILEGGPARYEAAFLLELVLGLGLAAGAAP